MKCEICGEREATHVCPRCRRLVCSHCFNEMNYLCKHCSRYLDTLRQDYMVYLSHVQKLCNELKVRMSTPQCRLCPIALELALTLLKGVRDVKRASEVHRFDDVTKIADTVEKELTTIAMYFLISHNLRSLRERVE